MGLGEENQIFRNYFPLPTSPQPKSYMNQQTFFYILAIWSKQRHRTDHSQHWLRAEIYQSWSRLRGKMLHCIFYLWKANQATWSPLCSQASIFCYFSGNNCTSGSEDLSTETALQSFFNCNCDWRMPELADQLGNNSFCQQDQKTYLS